MSQFDPDKRHGGGLGDFFRRLFPARQIVVRSDDRVRFYRLTTANQVTMAAAVALITGWGVLSSIGFVAQSGSLHAKGARLASVEATYESAVERIDEHRRHLASLAEDLERNRRGLTGAETPAAEPKGEGKATAGGVEQPPPASRKADRDRLAREGELLAENLRQQVERLGQDIATLAERRGLTLEADNSQIDARKLKIERDLATRERDDLDAQLGNLRAQVADMEGVHTEVLRRVSELAGNGIGGVEKALGAIGLDVKKLVDPAGRRHAANQGGPYIPLPKAIKVDDAKLRATLASLNVQIGRWDNLQQLARTVPLGAPLEHYHVSSPFGAREDPINGHPARHEGIDLSAPTRTAVHATAGGVVRYAGWRDRYGRAVIVDHGRGFVTLYGHLHKTLVRVGQRVESGAVLGQVGSTGRSTGPHLHYEVQIEGKPQDPSRFMKAGRNVHKG